MQANNEKKEYLRRVTEADLDIINKALCMGADVRIQTTPDNGYRIVADNVKVLKRSIPRRPKDHE